VDVLSTDAVQIENGATMRLLEWGGAAPLEARVRLVEPAGFTKVSALGVDEQRVNVVGDVLHAPASLGDGYRVQAQIVTWAASDVLRIPNSALFRTDADWTAFVVVAGRAQRRTVRLGHRGAHESEVLAGIAAGDQVILFPSDRIVQGGRVRASSRGKSDEAER
jgi:HlyD family secretion protein